MKVGVDARALVRAPTGIGNYLRLLLEHLEHTRPSIDCVLFVDLASPPIEFASDRFKIRYVRAPLARPRVGRNFGAPLWLTWVLPRAACAAGVDVLFVPEYFGPIAGPPLTVMTMWDFAPYELERGHQDALWRWYARTVVPLATRHAALLIVPSRATYEAARRFVGAPAEKLRIIHPAVEDSFRRMQDEARLLAIRRKYGLVEPFFLYVGELTARKNVVTAIRAFVELVRAHNVPRQLALRGRQGYGGRTILTEIQASGMRSRIVQLPRLPSEELAALYNSCEALLLPSLTEGFGFPLLEAMACGAPVVASNRTCLPEVLDGAGLLVDPLDVSAWTDSMKRVALDSQLRAELTVKGLERATRFSWQTTVRETISVFQEALEPR